MGIAKYSLASKWVGVQTASEYFDWRLDITSIPGKKSLSIAYLVVG
jgi:hypothetical protein